MRSRIGNVYVLAVIGILAGGIVAGISSGSVRELSPQECRDTVAGDCCLLGPPFAFLHCSSFNNGTTGCSYNESGACEGTCWRCNGSNWVYACEGESGQCNYRGTQDCGDYQTTWCSGQKPQPCICWPGGWTSLGTCNASDHAGTGC